MSTQTTNMDLTVPEVDDSDYPGSIEDSLDKVDAHDHTTGKGVPVPAGGLAANAVTTVKILDGSVTLAKQAAPTTAVSSSSGSFSDKTGLTVDVTNLTATVVVPSGRAVLIKLIPDGDATDAAGLGVKLSSGSTGNIIEGEVYIVEDSTIISRSHLLHNYGASTTNTYQMSLPPSALSFLRLGATAASHTYKVQVNSLSIAAEVVVFKCKLVVMVL